jgi:reverse gyrase
MTKCKTCNTDVNDCDILDGFECATCLRQQLDAAALDYDVCNRMRQQAENANYHNGDIIMQLMKDKDDLTARLAEAEAENAI